MDTSMDIERDKYNEWKEEQKTAREEACRRCLDKPSCPFYDEEENHYDYDECFESR